MPPKEEFIRKPELKTTAQLLKVSICDLLDQFMNLFTASLFLSSGLSVDLCAKVKNRTESSWKSSCLTKTESIFESDQLKVCLEIFAAKYSDVKNVK